MSTKIKQVQAVYEVATKNPRGRDIRIRTYLHEGYIEIIDDDMDKKGFVFAGKDSPEKRAYWLKILKIIETAIKLTPSGKE